MWLAGAVGVATALGFYVIATGVALLAVVVMAALRVLAHKILRRKVSEEKN
jgi:putative Mg2+ transporter-C (MgtC) family protein